jgi:hypothetical protein
VVEASTDQDEALTRLARALDAVVSVEWSGARKVRLVGEDNEYMVEHEIRPEHLEGDVDYQFAPGSMLSNSREALINAVIEFKNQQMISPQQAASVLDSAVPDPLRKTLNRQRSAARRFLNDLRERPEFPPQPQPFHEPGEFMEVLGEFMLSRGFEFETAGVQQAALAAWDFFRQQAQAAQMPPPQQPGAQQPQQPAAGGTPVGAVPEPNVVPGAMQLGDEAERAMTQGAF